MTAIKRPLIVGSKGNMARRYQAILTYLGVDFIGVDKGDPVPETGFDGILIATPTETHCSLIREFSDYRVPILCEKPISLDVVDVEHTVNYCRTHNVRLQMIDQYSFLQRPHAGMTLYNYFKHGQDGLAWDCINIIGNAIGDVYLGEFSPIWRCTLNGSVLDIADMDRAYIDMVRSWLRAPRTDLDYITRAHRKVGEFQRNAKTCDHRDTGPFWFHTFAPKGL